MVSDISKASNIEELRKAILNSDSNYTYKTKGRKPSSVEYEVGNKAYELKANEGFLFDRDDEFSTNKLFVRLSRLNKINGTNFKFAIAKTEDDKCKIIRIL